MSEVWEKRVICRCEEVTEEEIRQVICMGDQSPDAVKRRTRAGMGLCQGKTCSRLVAGILQEETGISRGELPLPSVRPPVSPIPLGVLATGADQEVIRTLEDLPEDTGDL